MANTIISHSKDSKECVAVKGRSRTFWERGLNLSKLPEAVNFVDFQNHISEHI